MDHNDTKAMTELWIGDDAATLVLASPGISQHIYSTVTEISLKSPVHTSKN